MKARVKCITLEDMVKNQKPKEFIEEISRQTKTTYILKNGMIFRKSDLWQQETQKQRVITKNFMKLYGLNGGRCVIEEVLD